MNELDKFKEQAEEARVRRIAKMREMYQYARDNGFTSAEATRLSTNSKKKIDQLIALKRKV